jgi:hypothetical protein
MQILHSLLTQKLEQTRDSFFSKSDESGIFQLIHPKGKQIDYNTLNDDWTNVNLNKSSSKLNLENNLINTKNHLDRLKKIPDVSEELIQSQENRIKKLQKYVDDYDNIITDEKAFKQMRATLGDITTTDNIASYISSTDLNKIILRDINDGGLGDVTIVNNKPGNYLKSRVGNVGFFDMTNPNIYKGLVPIGLGTNYLLNQKETKQMGGNMNSLASRLNTGSMRKDIKKASVGEDFMAGLYGVGEGLLDTLTFGMTDDLTDAGFSALQSAAGITGEEAARQKGIAGWGNTAGAIGGAIINPAAIGSAVQEGVEGIGTGIKGIDPTNTSLQGIGTALEKMPNSMGNSSQLPQGLDSMTKMFLARNGGKFKFQKGGNLNQNMGLTEVNGLTHEQGGVTLPNSGGRPDIEVENKETIFTPENFVMSDTIKASAQALRMLGLPPKYKGKTYAQISKLMKTAVGDKLRPTDPLTKQLFRQKMEKLIQAHLIDKEAQEKKNVIATTPEEQQQGYNMFPNAESITFPGQGPTQVVPTNNNEPIMVTGADGSQQLLTNQPVETQAPFMEQKLGKGGNMIKRADGSYSKRGLWDNIRANRGSGKKPTKEMLKQEAKIKKSYQNGSYLPAPNSSFQFSNTVNFTRPNLLNTNSVRTMSYPERQNYLKEQERKEGRLILDKRQNPLSLFDPSDESNFENIAEILDPTGLTSWDDVYSSVKDNGLLSADTGLEVFGALPILGKVGKIGKSLLRSTPNTISRLNRNQKLVGTSLSAAPVLGKTTDAVQAIQQSNTSPSFPYDKPKKEFGGYMTEQYNPLAEYEVPEVDYKNGGYTVRKSNDRKGKTHVVTGPDGTKKYFGDPKLGERSKSKYGKDAFYARHKKNLDKNPYFRAYAKATWEDGGYFNLTNDAVEMYKNGGNIYNSPMGKKANFVENYGKEDGGYMYQMGGGLEQPQQNLEQQNPEQQMMEQIAQAISQGMKPEQIIQGLVQQGIPQEQAMQMVQMVVQQLTQQQQPQGMPMGGQEPQMANNQDPTGLPMVMRKGGRLYFQKSGFIPSANDFENALEFPDYSLELEQPRNPITPVNIQYENPLERFNNNYPTSVEELNVFSQPAKTENKELTLKDYKSPMGNYIAGGIGSLVGPAANIIAAAAAPDPTYTAAPKFKRLGYTPVALRRAANNQALATLRDSLRTQSPTQGNFISNMATAAPSMGASLGNALAETRYSIDAQNLGIDNQEAQAIAQMAAQNALLKDQSIAQRWQLGLKGAEGIGKSVQGFTKDMGSRSLQDMMIQNMKTKDFGLMNYEIKNGRLVPRINPSGTATYPGEIRLPNGQRVILNPDGTYTPIEE